MAEATIAAVVVAGISTGITVYSQQKAADTQERINNRNAQIAERNARVNALMAQRSHETQAQMASAQAAAQRQNASYLRNVAEGEAAQGREAIRRKRAEAEKLKGMQRARFAKAGLISSEGSPLEVLADTAGMVELGIQDDLYRDNLQRSAKYRQADLEELGANFTSAEAGVSLYKARAAEMGLGNALADVRTQRLIGQDQVQGMRNQSYATILQGATQAAGSYASQSYYSSPGSYGGNGSMTPNWRANAA